LEGANGIKDSGWEGVFGDEMVGDVDDYYGSGTEGNEVLADVRFRVEIS
jgi:hypothetical protein